MSALDDVLFTARATATDAKVDEASAELELLREAAWRLCETRATPKVDASALSAWCSECRSDSHHGEVMGHCRIARILRTDPERARRMGLGWAL